MIFAMKDLSKKRFSELTSLYTLLNEICEDYSRMTDMYSLASGDRLFENVPEDMIEERQKFFNIRNKIKEEIKRRLIRDYDE